MTLSTRVATSFAARYVEQLSKHWSHKLAIEPDGAGFSAVMLNGAIARFAPETDALGVSVEAADRTAFDEAREAIESHLDRFAFREGPLRFDWSDGRQPEV